jgi:hypothetical protein
MSQQHDIAQIRKQARTQQAEAPPEVAAPQAAEGEARALARELIVAFVNELKKYRKLAADQGATAEQPAEQRIESILELPPHMVTFDDLEEVSRVDPARAFMRWEEMRAAARDDLISGRIASYAVEEAGGTAWERAMFLAIREALYRAWSPRHAGEAMLLDEMAQYESIRLKWVSIASRWSRDPRIQHSLRNREFSGKMKREISAAEANIEAMRMVERLQKLYQNALRMLLDSRRGKSVFIAQRAKQMNFAAGPQMNCQV